MAPPNERLPLEVGDANFIACKYNLFYIIIFETLHWSFSFGRRRRRRKTFLWRQLIFPSFSIINQNKNNIEIRFISCSMANFSELQPPPPLPSCQYVCLPWSISHSTCLFSLFCMATGVTTSDIWLAGIKSTCCWLAHLHDLLHYTRNLIRLIRPESRPSFKGWPTTIAIATASLLLLLLPLPLLLSLSVHLGRIKSDGWTDFKRDSMVRDIHGFSC